jgi:hypothetical protein
VVGIIGLNKVTTVSQFYSIGPSISLFSVLHVLHNVMCLHVTRRTLEVLQNSRRLLRTFMCWNVKQRSVQLPAKQYEHCVYFLSFFLSFSFFLFLSFFNYLFMYLFF